MYTIVTYLPPKKKLYSYSEFGHDKSQAILQYRRLASPPTLFFFGDGVSGK